MQQSNLNIHRLVLYRDLLKHPIIQHLQILLNLTSKNATPMPASEQAYFDFYYLLLQAAKAKNISGDIWRNYLLQLIVEDENIFSLACEQQSSSLSENLLQLASHDLEILMALYKLDWAEIQQRIGPAASLPWNNIFLPTEASNFQLQYHQHINDLGEVWNSNLGLEEKHSALIAFYQQHACGQLARYVAFRWDNGLIGIDRPDPISFDDLVGYEHQKELLINNTRTFVAGQEANNVLLYGEKGTGKSSSVKALLNKFYEDGLRMVELSKMQLGDYKLVIQSLRKRGQRFILFIDDLSFEDFEVDYKYIKASLEGSLEAQPENVLIYVTSNRRHLIKENWSDRQSSNKEVYISDTHQEKLSFADRFGISISYYTPNQEQYLNIVEDLAKKRGILIPSEELRRQAIQWELGHNGRSGRTAQQFITDLGARS
ncbi:MAG: ATP-binding protein [Syntrophomonas sp.]|nr:ATP-binding protein [Syntrophomonas sp.]